MWIGAVRVLLLRERKVPDVSRVSFLRAPHVLVASKLLDIAGVDAGMDGGGGERAREAESIPRSTRAALLLRMRRYPTITIIRIPNYKGHATLYFPTVSTALQRCILCIQHASSVIAVNLLMRLLLSIRRPNFLSCTAFVDRSTRGGFAWHALIP